MGRIDTETPIDVENDPQLLAEFRSLVADAAEEAFGVPIVA
jgi:hypothetical protein